MDLAIEDVLEVWALYECPYLLQDQELFNKLVRFIHQIALRAVREERERQTRLTAN